MSLPLFLAAAALLAFERGTYVWVARRPRSFLAAVSAIAGARQDPTRVVERLFLGFKILQAAVFAAWWLAHGGVAIPDAPPSALAAGAVAIVVGQTLNVAVFRRLGRTGVFYGDRFGHDLPRVESFPFSIARHPQYLGAVATIWGLFAIARFPHPDWWALPALETAYYALGAWLESGGRGAASSATISNARTSSVART